MLMKHTRRVLSAAILTSATLAMSALLAFGDDGAKAKKHSLDDLAWLAGHWQSKDGKTTVEEVWLPSRGGTMIGMNRTTREKGDEFEFLRIAQDGDMIAYLAAPGGKYPPTAFTMKSVGKNEAEFENPDNDFPKIIKYKRTGDTLVASIHGDDNQEMSWTWKLANKLN
jgi:Domain of unknown function (DUF6265)